MTGLGVVTFFLAHGTGCAFGAFLIAFYTALLALVAAVYRFGVIPSRRHVLLVFLVVGIRRRGSL